ncbi:MAG: hypothetical protein ACREBS_07075 [Nitrososphaerales archaeon]
MEEYDVLRCIDKGLEPFGSHVKQTIFWRMAILHDSTQSRVIANPGILSIVLHELLGDSASGIEKSIIKEIRRVFDLSVEESRTLTDAITSATKQVILVSSS